uniref:Ig-like domain-containing protein n=1 Tax=Paramormyrops kingsleyae TaxID=1676925 RepID=A0A3B3RD43_9TELE
KSTKLAYPSCITCSDCLVFPVTHSLQYVYTGMSGIPDFPEFVSMGLVNGEPIDYYDSKVRRVTPRQRWLEQSVGPGYWEQQIQYSWYAEGEMKNSIEVAKKLFNHTEGKWCMFTTVILTSNTVYHGIFIRKYPPPLHKYYWEIQYLNLLSALSVMIGVHFICGCFCLSPQVRPEVSLLQKDPSSPVTCHATGFFPKGIVVTWRKDGVDMHSNVAVGKTLPNGDGTFQITSKLWVKPEDWKMNSYSCVVQHKSLQDDIAVLLQEKNIRTNQGKRSSLPWGIIVGCVAAALALVAVVIGLVLWRRSRTASDTDSENSSQQQPKA